MDNLVLIRVAAVYNRTLRGASLRDLRQDAGHRFRLVLASGEEIRSVALSIAPAAPWTGRPTVRGRSKPLPSGPFAGAVARALRGAVVTAVEKPHADRVLTFRFADGHALVVELVPRRPNLLLLDRRGRLLVAARRPRLARGRLRPGQPYRPATIPAHLADPFALSAPEIGSRIADGVAAGRGMAEVLRREFAGIGPTGAALLAREAVESGRAIAELVPERLGRLVAGEAEPTIEAPEPTDATPEGRLLPWVPPWPVDEGLRRQAGEDAAATAGLFYEAAENARERQERTGALRALLAREVRRLRGVETRIAGDLASFEDPERYRRWGEALLAGLKGARRTGEHVLVADPYGERARSVPIPVRPGEELTAAAERYFARHRRATRGLQRARARARTVEERCQRLARLLARFEAEGSGGPDELERAMQGEGIPVGLLQGNARRADGAPARVEGVRLFLSQDGDTVMVGKSGRDNHRLTFKLAGPEDFWLHAAGVPGAHVVVRNPARVRRPRDGTLIEAAEAAAWYSEAREQTAVDVHWTLRKCVRKLRGAPPGTVKIKRSETVRVRPRRPAALETAP